MHGAFSVLRRPPRAALRPFVRLLWASHGAHAGSSSAPCPAASDALIRERMLPAGTCHVVLRLGDRPVRLFSDAVDVEGVSLGAAVVGGPRIAAYVRDATPGGPALGVELEAGAAPIVLGVPAQELAHRHVPLDAIWGGAVATLREQLAATEDPGVRLDLLEDALLARVRVAGAVHPAVVHAVRRLEEGATVAALCVETGYGARHLNALFHHAVGLGPKAYARVRRFGRALELGRIGRVCDGLVDGRGEPAPAASGIATWAAIAAAAGYADQAHLARDFRAIAGITPGAYRALAPVDARHVPLARPPIRSRPGLRGAPPWSP